MGGRRSQVVRNGIDCTGVARDYVVDGVAWDSDTCAVHPKPWGIVDVLTQDLRANDVLESWRLVKRVPRLDPCAGAGEEAFAYLGTLEISAQRAESRDREKTA